MKRWKQGWICLEGNPFQLRVDTVWITEWLRYGAREVRWYFISVGYVAMYFNCTVQPRAVCGSVTASLSSGITVVYFSDIIIHVL